MANYVLEILDGDRAGEVLPVGDRLLRIGRKSGNDIVIADEKTSGVHCEIAPEGDRLVLKDLGSTNGTFLDGKRVTEIVLTPGDVVTIGRTKVRFRSEDDAAAGSGSDEFAVRQLDAGRVQRRGGSLGLLVVLLLVVVGGGGWFWWQSQQQDAGGETGTKRRKDPLVVSGNRLDFAVGSCEAEDGWNLRAAGLGFRTTSPAHTGTGAFVALRGGEEADESKSDADFAVLQTAEPITVFAGRSLTVAAHCRTVAGAKVSVRARVFAANEQLPFRFCSGAALSSYDDGWQRVEAQVAVPTGCDRMLVEVVAVLPSADAEALVDDVAVFEGPGAKAVELRLAESGQTAFGFGASLAVRSTDADNPATVLTIAPASVPSDLAGLDQAGQCVLSDLGAELTCSAADKSFTFTATGVDGLQFVMPSEAAGGLLVAGDDGKFRSAAAESGLTATSVLVGSYSTRAMLRFAAPTAVQGQVGGGLYRLTAASPTTELVLGFRSERQLAGQHVRQAESAAKEGRPGAALDALDQLFASVPMDSEELARAQQLRGQLLGEQADRLRRLQKELEEAGFFSTRGGFERVASGVQAVIDLYGEHNLEDLPAARQLLASARERLAQIDGQNQQVQRDRLTSLADAFGASQQAGLQQVVQSYISKHLPPDKPGEKPGENQPDRNK